jgi:hypothetical protein
MRISLGKGSYNFQATMTVIQTQSPRLQVLDAIFCQVNDISQA